MFYFPVSPIVLFRGCVVFVAADPTALTLKQVFVPPGHKLQGTPTGKSRTIRHLRKVGQSVPPAN